MNERDTYEFEKKNCRLEYIEWDDIWRENAPDISAKKFFAIGDSITRGYRPILNRELGGKMFVDHLATSKAVDNSNFKPLLSYMKAQCPKYDVIQFNNGLHGWHIDTETYKKFYTGIIEHLAGLYPDTKIIIALTTPVREKNNVSKLDDRNHIVTERNQAALEIAAKFGFPVNDLYGVVIDHPEFYAADGVHMNEEGYLALAQQCIKMI